MARLTTYERLRRYIYRGRLRPGQKIVERELARQLNISRIPLRESLARLEADGLVRMVPYSSTYIEDFTADDLMEIYALRQALEPIATARAAAVGSAALVRTLRRLCDRMTQHTRLQQWSALDRTDHAFHLAIFRACGQKRLLRAYESAHVCMIGPRTQYAALQIMPPETTARDHLAIMEAIESGNAMAAERAARKHVESSMKAVERILKADLGQQLGPGAED